MLRKNVAGQHFCFALINASTGAALTGATVACHISIDGAAQAAATGGVTEMGLGQYSFAPSQADTNGNQIGYLFTATSAIPLNVNVVTTACDPTSAAFGLSLAKTTNITGFNDIAATAIVTAGAITTSSGAVSSVTTVGSVTGSVGSVTSVVTANVTQIAGASATTVGSGVTFPESIGTSTYSGTDTPGTTTLLSRITTAPPTASAIATAVWTDTTAGDFTVASSPGKAIFTSGVPVVGNVTVGGYAAGQDPATLVLDVAASSHDVALSIGAKVNSAGSAADPWSTAIPGSYAAGTAGAIVGANLNATVSSRSTYAGGAVASVTAPVTVGTNSDKTGYTLGAAQTFSTTGSVGSVTGSVGAVSGNVTVGGYATGEDPATLVLDATAASYRNTGSVGAMLSTLGTGTTGSTSDPWATTLPGTYPPGTAGAILGGNLDAQVSAIKVKTDALPTSFPVNFQALAVDATTGGVTVLVNQDKSGYNLGLAGLDAIQVESGVNARQALSPILAASAGLVSGAGTGTIVITGGNTTVTRITATTDKYGNRSAVTLALPPATPGGVATPASSYFPSAYFPSVYFPIGKSTQSGGNATP